jgi:hypothetical protein
MSNNSISGLGPALNQIDLLLRGGVLAKLLDIVSQCDQGIDARQHAKLLERLYRDGQGFHIGSGLREKSWRRELPRPLPNQP